MDGAVDPHHFKKDSSPALTMASTFCLVRSPLSPSGRTVSRRRQSSWCLSRQGPARPLESRWKWDRCHDKVTDVIPASRQLPCRTRRPMQDHQMRLSRRKFLCRRRGPHSRQRCHTQGSRRTARPVVVCPMWCCCASALPTAAAVVCTVSPPLARTCRVASRRLSGYRQGDRACTCPGITWLRCIWIRLPENDLSGDFGS